MKKYALGLCVLILAVGLSSFTVLKTRKQKQNFSVSYWYFNPAAIPSETGYATELNWLPTNWIAFQACTDGFAQECVLEVSATVVIFGRIYPNLSGLSFDWQGFPIDGEYFVANATKS